MPTRTATWLLLREPEPPPVPTRTLFEEWREPRLTSARTFTGVRSDTFNPPECDFELDDLWLLDFEPEDLS
ncbi:hypothetical protein GCM10009593_32800 [Microlunatus antarcticus]